MNRARKVIGIFHLKRFNLDVAFHALNSAIPNTIEIIYDWKDVMNNSCGILIIVHPELLYAQYGRSRVHEVIESFNMPIVIISYQTKSKIPSNQFITLLKSDTTFEQLLDKLEEIELHMKCTEAENHQEVSLKINTIY